MYKPSDTEDGQGQVGSYPVCKDVSSLIGAQNARLSTEISEGILQSGTRK